MQRPGDKPLPAEAIQSSPSVATKRPGASELSQRLATYAMIGAVLISYLYLLDPTDNSWGADAFSVLKYLPIELSLVAMALYSASIRSRANRSLWARSLAVLSAFILAGSIYTMLAYGHAAEDSFLGRGLGILALFPAVCMFSLARESRLFRKWFWPATLLCAMAMTVQLVVWRSGIRFVDVPHIFHEEVVLLAGAPVLAYALLQGRFSRWPIVLLLFSGPVLTLKNTGFLASLIVAGIILAMVWQRTRSEPTIAIVLRRSGILQLVAAVGAVGAFILLVHRELLPSGSPEVRLVTYAQRLGMFLDSPVIGQLFTGTPIMKLTGRLTTLVAPSHSDILDILAFGGLVGFFLFMAPMAAVALRGVVNLSSYRSRRDWLGAYFLAVLAVFGMEMLFNPVWNQPKLVFSFWLAVGYFLTLHSRSNSPHKGRTIGIG